MNEHMCRDGWQPGLTRNCHVCRPYTPHGPAYLKEGYKNSTRRIARDRNGSHETVHWSGRQDAHINVKPVRLEGRKQGDY